MVKDVKPASGEAKPEPVEKLLAVSGVIIIKGRTLLVLFLFDFEVTGCGRVRV